MMTEESIDRLVRLVEAQPEPARTELAGVLEDLARVIATQALLNRNLRTRLDNADVSAQTIARLVTDGSLENLLQNFSPPKRNPFTMKDARDASEQLVARINQAGDFATVFKFVVEVAKVFI